jgi:DNA mismatch endonuclease (patch repair protein)
MPQLNPSRHSSDFLSPEERSALMARIPGRGNRTTELAMVGLFRQAGITGWRRHVRFRWMSSTGRVRWIRPDFAFPKWKLAVFVDGCFWHGCSRCFRLPKQNRLFWRAKIEGNRRRDRSVNGRLKKLGWKVIRIRECQLRKPEWVLAKIQNWRVP